MWLVRNKNTLINMDIYELVALDGQYIHLKSLSDEFKIDFDNHETASLQFKYILEGLKRKEEVVNI